MSFVIGSAFAGAACAVLALIVPPARAQSFDEIVPIAGSVVAASVAPGQENQHRLHLQPDSYARIVIEPHNCDLNVTISERESGATRVLRTPYGTRNYITISFVAHQAGTVKLLVATTKGTQTVGDYQIRTVEVRGAEPKDEEAIQAQSDFSDAESLKEGSKQDRERALDKLKRATTTFESIGRDDERGEGLREMGRVLIDLDDSAQALEVLNQALSLGKERRDEADHASTLTLLGEADDYLGNTGRSIEDLKKAVAIRESLEDTRGQITSLNNLAVVYGDAGDPAKALEIQKRILPMCIATGNRRGELEALLSLEATYRDLGDIPDALDSWRQASELLPSFDDPLLKGEAFLNIGAIYSAIGEKGKALDSYLAGVEFAQKAGDRQTVGILLANLAVVYQSLGMPEKSLAFLYQSLSIAQAAKDPRQEARALERMASINHTLDNKQAALDLYAKSLAMCISLKDSAWEVLNLNGLGQVEEDLGDRSKALEFFERALQLVRQVRRPEWEALALANIAHVSTAMGSMDSANGYYEQAYEIAHQIGDHVRERQILSGMARLKYISGHLEEAHTLIDRTLALAEPLRDRVPGDELRSSYFASIQDLYSLDIEILMKLHKSQPLNGFDVVALNASETSRARGLLDRLAMRGQIREGLDPELKSREEVLAVELSGRTSRLLRLRLQNSPKSAAEIIDLQKKIAVKDNQYQELQAEIRRKSPRFANLARPKTLDLKQIQEEVVDSQSTLLEYSLGEGSSTLWVVDPQGLTVFELPKRVEIEAVARRYYDALTARNRLTKAADPAQKAKAQEADLEAQASGVELAGMLLNPAAGLIAKKRLLIVADGLLNYIPFSALPEMTAGEEIQPLSTAHQIVMLPSASVLALSRKEAGHVKPAPKTLAIFADPVFDADDSRVRISGTRAKVTIARPLSRDADVLGSITDRSAADGSFGLVRLPFTRREAEQIYRFVRPVDALEALDFRANRDIAIGLELTDYRIVHFATHGFLDDVNPAWSGLVLSLVDEHGQPRDGFLKLQDIYNLHLNTDLVVLSACRTALGKNVRGEGIVGLSRGFMYAGAKRVVASLWEVDDFATADLMARFYHKMLQEHQAPAGALRAAQVEMSQEKQWAAPYYWASFVLLGEPN